MGLAHVPQCLCTPWSEHSAWARRSRTGGRCAWCGKLRMKDGRMSVAHESGLTSLVPCTDRQVDLTGSQRAQAMFRHMGTRGKVRGAVRGACCTRSGRGAREERERCEERTPRDSRTPRKGGRGCTQYVRTARCDSTGDAGGGARTTLGSPRACRHARRARYGASGRGEGPAGLTRDSRPRSRRQRRTRTQGGLSSSHPTCVVSAESPDGKEHGAVPRAAPCAVWRA